MENLYRTASSSWVARVARKVREAVARARDERGQTILEYLLVVSVFVIIFRVIFFQFQQFLFQWFEGFKASVLGPAL